MPDSDPPPDTLRESRDTDLSFSPETLAELVDEQAPEYRGAWAQHIERHRAALVDNGR